MAIVYFDFFSGASGNMLLGSLLDCDLELEALRTARAGLPAGGYVLAAERVTRHGLTGAHLRAELAGDDRRWSIPPGSPRHS